MSSIDEIVNVSISVETPAATGDDCSGLLIVCEAPTNASTSDLPTVGKISYASDLTEYGFTTTSAAYYTAQIVFSQTPCASNVYFTVFDTSGEDTISDVLDAAKAYTGWYGFVLSDQSDGSTLKLAAVWAEANSRLFGFSYDDDDIPFDITSYSHTFALYYSGDEDNEYNEFGAAAWMSKCFGYEPGSETWSHKTLTSITASTLSTTTISTIYAIPANVYITIANKDVTREGKVGTGEWIDIIRMVDYLESAIQTKVFNYLTANAKVKYDDDGITGVQNAVSSVLLEMQTAGGIAADSYDDDGNITKGYTVSVPLAADIDAETKAARQLTDVTFTAYIAGAIHTAKIVGVLTY